MFICEGIKMEKKMLFIFNPKSGKSKIKNVLFDIVKRFSDADYEVTVYPTKKAGDCANKIRTDADRFDVVVVSGGDGTLHDAVEGMLELPKELRRPIGYIPAGTMNDFASTNNISSTPRDAVAEIINNPIIPYDIGLFNGHRFIYVAAFGAFTDVSYETPQVNKNLFGQSAYIFEGIKSLPKIKPVDVSIKTAEGDRINTSAYLVLIMNSTSVGGFDFGKFYEFDTADGMFEIVIIDKTVNLLELPNIATGIRHGKTDMPGITIISASKAEITTAEAVKWTLDGEYGGKMSNVEFEVAHNAVDFFISNNKKN